MSDQNRMRVFGTACVRRDCDDTVKDGCVDANGVLPSHKIVNDLQYRPIKRGHMVNLKDFALDPASNAMYVAKSSDNFELSILFGTASPHYSHILN